MKKLSNYVKIFRCFFAVVAQLIYLPAITCAYVAQLVEHSHGKGKVCGSNPHVGFGDGRRGISHGRGKVCGSNPHNSSN